MTNYDLFADKYMCLRKMKINPNNNIEVPAIKKLIGNVKGKKLLDIGCGPGIHAKIYATKGATVIGTDISKKLLVIAKKNVKEAKFLYHDLNKKLPFKNNTFDVVTSSLAFEYAEKFDELFKECSRVLKKDGLLFFSIPNPILYQKSRLIGRFNKYKLRLVFGDYFNRQKITRNFGKNIQVTFTHKTMQDYYDAFLKYFSLEKFVEAEPISEVKHMKFYSRNPYFLLFKLKKK